LQVSMPSRKVFKTL